jgi:glycosyltransferase involved in cell wall biosynthesis
MPEVSVIVCSHNPRHAYLARSLNGLRGQTLDANYWELLLVDNASKRPLNLTFDISWHPNNRHVMEPNLGLASARRRGICHSLGEILIFVDDDNVLDREYLLKAKQIASEWPMLGAWGAGLISPEFEVEPESHLDEFLFCLTLRQITTPRYTNVLPPADATPVGTALAIPLGAGLCVRRGVAEAYCKVSRESKYPITGRIGNVLLGGEDLELSYVATSLGFGVAVFPELKILHLIPKERISESYLVKIAEGSRISNILLDYNWFGTRPRSSFSARSLLALAKNILTTQGIHRRMHIAKWRAAMRAGKLLSRFAK